MGEFKSTTYTNIGTTPATIYSIPTQEVYPDYKIVVLGIIITNINASALTVDVDIVTDGTTLNLFINQPLGIGETFIISSNEQKIILSGTDEIIVTSSLANGVDCFMNYMVDTGEYVPAIPTWYGNTGVFTGGITTVYIDRVESIEISNGTMNASYGTLVRSKEAVSAGSNGEKAIIAGGYTGSYLSEIESLIISTATFNSAFSSLVVPKSRSTACGNTDDVGIIAGSYIQNGDDVESISFDTGTTNATFATLNVAKNNMASCSSGTHALLSGGYGGGANRDEVDTVEFLTGTYVNNFSTLSYINSGMSSSSDLTIGLLYQSFQTTTIDSILMATGAISTGFGSITTLSYYATSCSNGTLSMYGGGDDGGSKYSTIESTSFATGSTNNSYANLTGATSLLSSCSGD